nr:DNA polymerase eta [Tanacetum cinerariifolium]
MRRRKFVWKFIWYKCLARCKADLTIWRVAGSDVLWCINIVYVLARKGRCEHASIDEVYLDLTDAAETMPKETQLESLESIDEEVFKSHVLGLGFGGSVCSSGDGGQKLGDGGGDASKGSKISRSSRIMEVHIKKTLKTFSSFEERGSKTLQSSGKEENLMCKLKKSLHRLKQAPRQWLRNGRDQQAQETVVSKIRDEGLRFHKADSRHEHIRDKLKVGSVMYDMVCARLYIAHVVRVVSRFMSNPGREHWEVFKWLLRYLKDTSKATLCSARKELKLASEITYERRLLSYLRERIVRAVALMKGRWIRADGSKIQAEGSKLQVEGFDVDMKKHNEGRTLLTQKLLGILFLSRAKED